MTQLTTSNSLNVLILDINSNIELQQILNIFQTNDYDLTGCLYNCSQNGQCILDPSSQMYSCNCLTNFVGTSCQSDVRPCSKYPCLNNGTCINVDTNDLLSFKCECQYPYYGVFCEVKGNLCENITCSSHGYCWADEKQAQCKCFIDFYGDNCENVTVFIKIIKNVRITSLLICLTCISLFWLIIVLNDVSNLFISKNKFNHKRKKTTTSNTKKSHRC